MKSVFNTCFLILGCLILIVAMLIILVGFIGVLDITIREVFGYDIVKELRRKYESKRRD